MPYTNREINRIWPLTMFSKKEETKLASLAVFIVSREPVRFPKFPKFVAQEKFVVLSSRIRVRIRMERKSCPVR